MDNCIYAKFRGSNFVFLILYVDDILLASSDKNMLLETKRFLSSKFDMKDPELEEMKLKGPELQKN